MTRPDGSYITWPNKTNGLVDQYSARDLINMAEAHFPINQRLIFKKASEVITDQKLPTYAVAIFFPSDPVLKGVIIYHITWIFFNCHL